MKVMKDPTDLDIFEADQMAITRKVDETGMDGIHQFISNAMAACVLPMPLLFAALPLPLWQRAAYESHDLAKRDPTAFNTAGAKIIWLTVRFLQDTLALGRALAEEPGMRDEATRQGWKIPDLPDEE